MLVDVEYMDGEQVPIVADRVSIYVPQNPQIEPDYCIIIEHDEDSGEYRVLVASDATEGSECVWSWVPHGSKS